MIFIFEGNRDTILVQKMCEEKLKVPLIFVSRETYNRVKKFFNFSKKMVAQGS